MSNEKYITAEEAVRCIQTGDRVFIHGSAATPVCLVKALQARHKEIHQVELVSVTTMGTYQYSGIGGQMDFIRGASLSENGLPIIALPSVTSTGISRIVPFLKEGAGVVTTRDMCIGWSRNTARLIFLGRT